MTLMFRAEEPEQAPLSLEELRLLAHATTIIERTLAGALVDLGRVRPNVLRNDFEGLAFEVVEALRRAGLKITPA